MKTSVRYLLALPFPAFIKFILMKIRGKEYLVTGKCRRCGQCCKLINLRSRKGWLRNESNFIDLVSRFPEYSRFSTISKDKQGYLLFTCTHLKTGNGCMDYANRPEICKKYPQKSLILQGGQIIKGCGYSVQAGTSFSKHLSREIQKIQKNV